MRSRERLVQVDMKDVDPEIARPGNSHHGVEVGAVHVDQGSVRMQKLCDFGNLGFEHAEGVRIRDHDGRDIFVDDLFQVVQIDRPGLVRRNALDRVPGDRCAGGVGAVRGIRESEFSFAACPWTRDTRESSGCRSVRRELPLPAAG